MLPACPSPSIGLWVYWFQCLLFSPRVPSLRDGVTPAGSRFVCPRSERRFSLSIWVRSTSCRWCPISRCTSLWLRVFGDSWFSPLCSPDRQFASRFTCPVLPPVGRLSFRLGVFSFGWGFRLFLSVLLAPWGCRGTCCLPSMRLRISESSSLSAWSFPFWGLSLFLAFVPLLEALSESLTHSIPRSFLVVALSASEVGFAVAL